MDDKEANLIALEGVLGDMECDLLRASSGNEALRQLLKRDFALMLLDVQMPEMDGYEVARYARENPITRAVPIIFVTAMIPGEENALRGYGTGAVDYLFKPINHHILRSKVRVFLDLYRARQELAAEVKAHEETLEALRRSNAGLRHFTHAASHDLSAPLRAMAGFLDALEEEAGARLDEESAGYLARAKKATGRMRSLLDSLLVFCRLQTPVSFGTVACDELLEQVKSDLGDRIVATQCRLELGELPRIRGERNRLYQLFLNLVENAIKYQPTGGVPEVCIHAERRGDEYLFTIEDNGIGIPRECHKVIFEAFERAHSQSEYEGSGLGLAICQQIVEQHGGRIWVDSEPDQGSRFHFTLPAAT